MKAAYLYNFAQLTEWPQAVGREGEFVLCIAGQSGIINAVAELQGRGVQGRRLRLISITSATDAERCDMLFVEEGLGKRGSRMAGALRGKPVLTVTDDSRLGDDGVMLVIVPDGRRLAFEVNLALARQAKIKFSSKLLRLASRVSDE